MMGNEGILDKFQMLLPLWRIPIVVVYITTTSISESGTTGRFYLKYHTMTNRRLIQETEVWTHISEPFKQDLL